MRRAAFLGEVLGNDLQRWGEFAWLLDPLSKDYYTTRNYHCYDAAGY